MYLEHHAGQKGGQAQQPDAHVLEREIFIANERAFSYSR